MNTFLTTVGGFLLLMASAIVYVGGKVITHLVGEEVEGRINRIGYAMLHLVCKRLPEELREAYYEWWAAELDEYFQNAKELPLTRLFWALRFPIPLLFTGRRTARIQDPTYFEMKGSLANQWGRLLGFARARFINMPRWGVLLTMYLIGPVPYTAVAFWGPGSPWVRIALALALLGILTYPSRRLIRWRNSQLLARRLPRSA